jgi:hypothetical protein
MANNCDGIIQGNYGDPKDLKHVPSASTNLKLTLSLHVAVADADAAAGAITTATVGPREKVVALFDSCMAQTDSYLTSTESYLNPLIQN